MMGVACETGRAQCRVLGGLAGMIGAKVIVEAGTYTGVAARALAEMNPTAVVYTADVEDLAGNLPVNVVRYVGPFEDMLAGIDSVDFAYIDATGSGNDTDLRRRHGQLVLAKLTPRGIIAFDDTWTDWAGVEWIRDLCQINVQACKGLSLYQRPE